MLRHVADVFAWFGRAAQAATDDELDRLEQLTPDELAMLHGRLNRPTPAPAPS